MVSLPAYHQHGAGTKAVFFDTRAERAHCCNISSRKVGLGWGVTAQDDNR